MPEYRFIPRSEQATQIITRKTYGAFLTSVSLAVFLLVLVAYGATFFYSWYLNRQIKSYNETFEKKRAEMELDSIIEIIKKSGEIETAKRLLNSHKAVSNLFPILEKNNTKNNFFDSFSLGTATDSKESGGALNKSAGGYKITLTGQAKNFESMAKQIESFKIAENVASSKFSNFKLLKDGDVVYSLDLTITDKALKY